ncbi:hypothetical protein [Kitasatospora sp. LaBMicrA B282]|uniref:hypothetical protein n=1 Tax=Kitasatospora sp. LaBMicrA B282 TaxID=3420949 RepID=UPI003D11ED9B
MDGGQQRQAGIARLVALCAVLLGLFLMHGAPASAADGCHGAVGASASMTGGHAESVDPAKPAALAPAGAAAQPAGVPHAAGSPCVSTAARERTPLPPAGLLALAVLPVTGRVLGGLPAGAPLHRRRGPPGSGRELLIRVCIART